MNQPTNNLMSQRAHSGLTLVELLISIAISAIVVSITFSSLRTEQQRTAAKDATDRLQVELLGLQNKMQSGIALNTSYCTRGGGNFAAQGNLCPPDTCVIPATSPGSGQGRCVFGPPSGYGLTILKAGLNYTTFADMPNGLTVANGIYNAGSNDRAIATNKSLGQKIQVARLTATGPTGSSVDATMLTVTFSGNNGTVTLTDPTSLSCASGCTSAKIVLKHTVTGTCYSITIDKNSQIVGKRQFSPTCQ